MAFPNSLEAKFCRVIQTPANTIIEAKIWKVTDGGLDVDGIQIYNRTLWKQKTFIAPAGVTKQQVINYLKDRLSEINIQDGLGYAPANQICTL